MMLMDNPLVFMGLIYGVIGALAGIMAGILGIGGGVVVVPGLLFIFKHFQIIPDSLSMRVAAGCSLAVMIITSQSSLRAHLKMGSVLWDLYKKLAVGMLIGTIIGASMAIVIPTDWLQVLFAIFLIAVAIKMATDLHVTYIERFPSPWLNRIVSFFIGFQSGLLGVGGGLLVVPYLTYCGVAIRQIAAVSNLCTLTVAVVGTIVFMFLDHKEMAAIPYSSGFIYWPAVIGVAIPSSLFAPIGAKLNYVVPVKQLKYLFIIIAVLTAIVLIN